MTLARTGETRPQRSLKAGALPVAVWRSGAYFAPAQIGRRRRTHVRAGLPLPSTSMGGMFAVLADELVLAGFKITRDPPTAEAWNRIATEVDEAIDLFGREGWLDDPVRYHRTPSAPADLTIRRFRGWETLGLRWEQLRWTSDWAPNEGEPGRDRWMGYDRNHRSSAWVLRHRGDEPRHWAVLLHGTEQGRLLIDQQIFRARRLHHEFGCNVMLPLLPLHASRKSEEPTGTGFPTLDVLDNVHGLAESAYDVRCALAWIEEQDPLSISLTGLSLGGSVAALVAGLEQPLGAVVGLVPAVDFPEVFRRQTPRSMRSSEAFMSLDAGSRRLHTVVSPLSFRPETPSDRLHIVAGLHDRLLDPINQAGRLAAHWGTSNITWLDRGHVTHMVSPELVTVMGSAIVSSPSTPVS